MRCQKYDADKVILKILFEEKERQEEAARLECEMHELLAQGEMCDVERVFDIVEELNIIDPLAESEETEMVSRIETKQTGGRKIELPRKIRLIVAVSVSVLIILTSAVALNPFGVVDNFKDLLIKEGYTKVEQGNQEIHIVEDIREYSTIEEMMEAEDAKIIYPEVLPDSCELLSITVMQYEYVRYEFSYTDGMILRIDTTPQNSSIIDDAKIFEYDDFYVQVYFTEETGAYTAYWKYNGTGYELCGKTQECIIFVLENMLNK